MNILKLAAQIFLIYLLYRLVVSFIIPAVKTVRTFRKQFSQMQEGTSKPFKQNPTNNSTNGQSQPKTEPQAVKTKEGEYIEFEEVKD